MRTRFVFNLGGSKPKRRTLEGRDHLVIPAAIIGDDQVLEGSEGPILYPANENKKSVKKWNAQPAVVYHPKMGEKFISSKKPEIFNKQKVGTTFNSSHSDAKLRTEVWLDEKRTAKVDERVLVAARNGLPMEVSTGLDMQVTYKKGESNGKKYVMVGNSFDPDHLAILPDQAGAYSIAMGGGLFANEAKALRHEKSWDRKELKSLPPADFGDPWERKFPVANQKDLQTAASLLHHATDPGAVKRRLTYIANRLKLKVPETWTFSANEMSLNSVCSAVNKVLSSTYGEKGRYWNGWTEEVFNDRVVFYDGSKLYQQGYKIKNEKVELTGDRAEVVRTTDYQVVNLFGGNKDEHMPKPVFDRKAALKGLLRDGWDKNEVLILNKLPDKRLKRILNAKPPEKKVEKPEPEPKQKDRTEKRVEKVTANGKKVIYVYKNRPEKKVEKKTAANADSTPATMKAYLTDPKVPAEVRNMLKRQMQREEKERNDLIEQITANEGNEFSEKYLKRQPVRVLEAMAKLGAGRAKAPESDLEVLANEERELEEGFDEEDMFDEVVGNKGKNRIANYGGQGRAEAEGGKSKKKVEEDMYVGNTWMPGDPDPAEKKK